jgi:hypothetical protein
MPFEAYIHSDVTLPFKESVWVSSTVWRGDEQAGNQFQERAHLGDDSAA